jgi:hypothetical protein
VTETIGANLRRALAQRAKSHCEYCGIPEQFTAHRHEPDHIIATQHGGATTLDNLALACMPCNRHKGPNIASIDPESGELAPLFNPRNQKWLDHFRWNGASIEPRSPEARVTVRVLKLNAARRLLERESLLRAGVALPGSDETL